MSSVYLLAGSGAYATYQYFSVSGGFESMVSMLAAAVSVAPLLFAKDIKLPAGVQKDLPSGFLSALQTMLMEATVLMVAFGYFLPGFVLGQFGLAPGFGALLATYVVQGAALYLLSMVASSGVLNKL